MKKILLIGELNEITRDLNDCLSNEFQMQLCSEQVENLERMLRITKPDLVLVSQIGETVGRDVFECLRTKDPKIPVLVIGTREDWNRCKQYCESEQFDKLFRPIVNDELLDKCYEMLKMKTLSYNQKTDKEIKKVLVVDDNPLVLRNIKALLEEKYEVILATSGEMALTTLSKKEPDLILLDYEMPGKDGKQVFEEMKKDEVFKNIPVIFLTGKAKRDEVLAVLKSFPAGYILKPPAKDKLFECIKDALNED